MSIYTKKGDKGSTSLYGGRRVSKSIVRLEVIGCIDELNSLLGLINSKLKDEQKTWTDKSFTLTNRIERIQGELLQVGADIATPYSASTTFQKNIDRLPKLRYFIIPGGSETASIAQLARAMTRRAERNAVRLTKGAKLNPNVLKYLNRLSDWLFITARYINKNSGEKDKIWN